MGSSLASRPSDANRPTPSGRSCALGAASISTQVGAPVVMIQACVVEQSGRQPAAVAAHLWEVLWHTRLRAQSPAQPIALSSTFWMTKSPGPVGVAERARAYRSSFLKLPMATGRAWARYATVGAPLR